MRSGRGVGRGQRDKPACHAKREERRPIQPHTIGPDLRVCGIGVNKWGTTSDPIRFDSGPLPTFGGLWGRGSNLETPEPMAAGKDRL